MQMQNPATMCSCNKLLDYNITTCRQQPREQSPTLSRVLVLRPASAAKDLLHIQHAWRKQRWWARGGYQPEVADLWRTFSSANQFDS